MRPNAACSTIRGELHAPPINTAAASSGCNSRHPWQFRNRQQQLQSTQATAPECNTPTSPSSVTQDKPQRRSRHDFGNTVDAIVPRDTIANQTGSQRRHNSRQFVPSGHLQPPPSVARYNPRHQSTRQLTPTWSPCNYATSGNSQPEQHMAPAAPTRGVS